MIEAIEIHSFDAFIAGAFAMHEFPIDKPVSHRMDIFKGQLIPDILTDLEMDQVRKEYSYRYIVRKMNMLYSRGSSNGTSFEDAYNFKHEVREKLLQLIFKQVQ